ncbi:hypothetical protein ATCC90586_008973 [Pythium insidiosum]|nr:hypothetical protein ATCC90586_008973 [Pythium insidiosum]
MDDLLMPHDAEPLAAALAMIDAWEAVEITLGPSPARVESPAPSAGSTDGDDAEELPSTAPSSSQSMCTGSRRKREIEYLRSKACELEAELAALKARAAESWQSPAVASTTALWEQIATRQLTQRVQSEKTNARLRMTLQHQVQVARDLMRALTKAARRQDVDELAGASAKRVKTGELRVDEQVEIQQRRVDALHGRAASVFASAPFQTTRPVFRDVELLEDSLTGDSTICIRAGWAVPFAVHQVAAVIWRFMVQKAQDGGDEALDRLNIVYSTQATRPGMTGTFAGRLIARRHVVAPTAQLFAWVKQSEPLAFAPTPLDGVLLDEEALLRVQPAAEPSGHDSVTLVQSWRRLRVHFNGDDVVGGRRKVGALSEYLLSQVETELNWKQRVIENLLLEEAMASASQGNMASLQVIPAPPAALAVGRRAPAIRPLRQTSLDALRASSGRLRLHLRPRDGLIALVLLLSTQLVCVVFLVGLGTVHAYLARPDMVFYASSLVGPHVTPHFRAWGNVFHVIASLHVLDVVQVVSWKLIQRYPRLQVLASGHRRRVTATSMDIMRSFHASLVASRSATLGKSVLRRSRCWACAARLVNAALRRAAAALRFVRWGCRVLFGRRGLLGIESEYFTTVFVVRELVEAVAQCVQAYKFSRLIARSWINHVWVLSIVLDCWGTPLITRILLRDLARRRYAYLVSDVVVTIGTAVVLPTVIFVPWALQFDRQQDSFPPELLYDDKAFTQLLLESRSILAISTVDCVTKAIAHLGILHCLRALRGFVDVPPAKRTALSVPRNAVAPGSSGAPNGTTSGPRRRCIAGLTHALHVAGRVFFFLLGAVVVGAHLHAFLAHRHLRVDGCKQLIHPWFVQGRASCVVFEFSCYGQAVDTPGDVAFSSFHPDVLQFLVISHCPALVVPTTVRSFASLSALEIYNSTLVAWPQRAAFDAARQDQLAFVGVIRVNMSEFPRALLSPLPRGLNDVEFVVTNLTAIPDDLDLRWPSLSVVFIEHSLLTQFPMALLRMQTFQLSLAGNRISALPFDHAAAVGRLPYVLIMAGNPIRTLPDTLAPSLEPPMAILSLENTQVTGPLPPWTTDGGGVAEIVYLAGAPLCDEPHEETPTVALLACDVHSPAASGVYPLDCYRENVSTPTASAFDSFQPDALQALIISHCPALVVPSVLRTFHLLTSMDIYNATLIDWPRESAFDPATQPHVGYLGVVRVNMSTFPTGLEGPLPAALTDVEFVATNLTGIPDDLDLRWPVLSVFYVEHSLLTQFPMVVLRMNIFQLSLLGNQIATLPIETTDALPFVFVMSGNPISVLPQSIASAVPIGFLFVENTHIAAPLPTWITDGIGVTDIVFLFGSPLCGDRTMNMTQQMTPMIICDVPSEFQFGLVQDQAKLLRCLNRLIKRALCNNSQMRNDFILAEKRVQIDVSFEALLQLCDDMIHNVDTAFSDKRFMVPRNCQLTHFRVSDVTTSRDANGNAQIDMLNAFVLPFNVSTTADAIWQYLALSSSSETEGFHAQNIGGDDVDIVKKDLRNKHFMTVLVARELVEAISQCIQAYKFSKFISRPWINHVMVLAIIIDCWGTPLITGLIAKENTRRRIAYAVGDVVLTIGTSVVLPSVIFLPWVLLYPTPEFADVLYDDKAFIQMVLESQSILAISTGDCVVKAIATLDIYNSTLVAWPREAAFDAEAQTRIGFVGIVRVNMSTLPAALLEPLPIALNDIEIVATNLTALPADLDARWSAVRIVYVERSLLTEFPMVLLRLSLFQLSLALNQISTLPFDRVDAVGQLPLEFFLSGNPITSLPESIRLTDATMRLYLEDTKLQGVLPPWLTDGVSITDTVFLNGSPMCDDGSASTQPSVATIDCDRVTQYDIGAYPLAVVDFKRQQQRPLVQ